MKMCETSILEARRSAARVFIGVALILAGTLGLQACGGGSTPLPGLVAIRIAPSTSLLPLAGSRQLVATGIYSDGTQLDLTSQVTWTAASSDVSANPVSVNAGGVVTGVSLGSSVVSATMGPTIGLLQLTVNTNGFAASTVGILSATFNKRLVDIGYEPISQFVGPAGRYTVQAINLDADLFSTVVPVQTALVASIAMPEGFVPNATAASQASLKVAVISYSSPNVVIIDASNDTTDFTSNTVVATYTAPVTGSVTFKGKQCVLCAVTVNPLDDHLLLSTAEGYYSMNLSSGVFTQLSLTPPPVPAPSFVLDPVASSPYILSPTFGQDPRVPSSVQVLDLKAHTTTTNASFGLTNPNAAVVDVFTNNAAVVDTGANLQSLLNLPSPTQPQPTLIPDLSVCAGSGPPVRLDMVALAIGVSASVINNPHALFLGESSGSCIGFEVWPSTATPGAPDPTQIGYGYGTMPATPDGNLFVNGSDPNAIAAFTSVQDRRSYGLLLDAAGKWVAKLDLGLSVSAGNLSPTNTPLPAGRDVSNFLITGAGNPVIFLPTTGTFSLSANNIDFGSQAVGTPSIPSSVVLTNAGSTAAVPQISIEGAAAGDFTQSNDCSNNIPAQGNCTITLIFTPTAQGTRTANLTVDGGGGEPLTVALTGTGS